MRTYRKPILVFIIIVTLWCFYAIMKPRGKSKINKNVESPPDPLNIYATSVNRCLLSSTARFNKMSQQESFDNYWRSLPNLADACSVNPQISLRSVPTKSQTNLFYIENMDSKTPRGCQVVSANNAVELGSEQEFQKQNPNCMIYASDELFEEVNVDGFDIKNFKVLPTDESGDPKQIGLKELVEKTNTNDPVDVLIIGDSDYDLDFAALFDKKNDILNDFVFCQVNLMIREPRSRNQKTFINFVKKLIEDDRYILMRADKDSYSLHMQLFFVNHQHPFCRQRYIRRYTFD